MALPHPHCLEIGGTPSFPPSSMPFGPWPVKLHPPPLHPLLAGMGGAPAALPSDWSPWMMVPVRSRPRAEPGTEGHGSAVPRLARLEPPPHGQPGLRTMETGAGPHPQRLLARLVPLCLSLLLGPGRPGTAEEGEETGGCSWSLGCQKIGV